MDAFANTTATHTPSKLTRLVSKSTATYPKILVALMVSLSLAGCFGGPSIGSSQNQAPHDIAGCVAHKVDLWAFFSSDSVLTCEDTDALEEAKKFLSITQIIILDSAQSKQIDFTGFDNLTKLHIENTTIEKITLSANIKIKEITLDTSNLTQLLLPDHLIDQLDIVNAKALTSFNTAPLKVQSLSVSGPIHFDITEIITHPELTSLQLSDPAVDIQSLPAAPNLLHLSITSVITDTLDVSQFAHLARLYLYKVDAENLDLSQVSGIKDLRVSSSKITHLTLPTSINLESVYINKSELDTLNLANLAKLSTLDLQESKVQEADLTGLNNLTRLNISNSTIETIKHTSFDNLTRLELYNPTADLIDFSETPKLRSLKIEGGTLSELDLSNTAIWELSLKGVDTPSIKLPIEATLTRIDIQDHEASSLTIEGASTIESLAIEGGKTRVIDIQEGSAIGFVRTSDVNLDSLDLSTIKTLEAFSSYNSLITVLNLPEPFSQESINVGTDDLFCINFTKIWNELSEEERENIDLSRIAYCETTSPNT